jgi:hypothetical protein
MRFRDLIAAVKSSRDLDRSFVWTRGSQEASSEFGDRDFIMQRTQCNENPDFAKCEIPTESEPSDQHVIWTVDPTHVGGPRHPGTRGTIRG